MAEKAVAEKPVEVSNDTMTMGDFMARSTPEPVSVAKPGETVSAKDTMTYDEFMGKPAPAGPKLVTPVPDEHGAAFTKYLGNTIQQMIFSGTASINEGLEYITRASPIRMMGEAVHPDFNKEVRDLFIGAPEEKAAGLRAELDIKNKPLSFAQDSLVQLGSMGVTLPYQLMVGGMTKLALAEKVAPAVATALGKVPDLVLGAGFDGWVKGVEKDGNILEKTYSGVIGSAESMALTLLYIRASGVTQESIAGKPLAEVKKLVAKATAKGFAYMPIIGAADALYQAGKKGRIASFEEIAKGAVNGLLLHTFFTLLPHLKTASKIPGEKLALGEYEAKLNAEVEKGDIVGAQQVVDKMLADGRIRPEIKEIVVNMLQEEKPAEEGLPKDVKTFEVKAESKAESKAEPKAEPKAESRAEPKAEPQSDVYDRVFQLRQARKAEATPVKNAVKKHAKGLKADAETIFGSLSSRLNDIDPSLKYALRRFEFELRLPLHQYMDRVNPFIDKAKQLSQRDASDLDFALKNRYTDKVDKIIDSNNMRSEFDAMKQVLEELHANAKAAGLDIGYIWDYFPRRVANSEGLLNYLKGSENWDVFGKAVELQNSEIGYEMDFAEQAEFLNGFIRRPESTRIWLKMPANAKQRLLGTIAPEMDVFYKDSVSALKDYIQAIHTATETRKFFGKGASDITKSIGGYVQQLVDDGIITADQMKTVSEVITSRFNQKGLHGFWNAYKNLSILSVIHSPLNALVQLKDLGVTIYRDNPIRTVQGLFGEILPSDVGIYEVGQEFIVGGSLSSEAVKCVFNAIGFKFFDMLGPRAAINAGLAHIKENVVAGDPRTLEQLNTIFGTEAPQVVNEIKNNVLSKNVAFLLFNRVLDFQPRAASEMPAGYNAGGTWRLGYVLKSYQLKILDVYRNEVFKEMETNPAQGVKNFVRLTATLMAVNAPIDWLIAFIGGKSKPITDYMLNSILQIAGSNKYDLINMKRDGPIRSTIESILPPVPYVDAFVLDLLGHADIQDWKLWSKIPVVGRLYYDWLGGGSKNRGGGSSNSGVSVSDIFGEGK